MFINRKNDIKEFPFQECANLSDASTLEDWATAHNLHAFGLWMLPQIQAHFGQFRVTRNAAGLFDPKQLLADNIKDKPWEIGLWRICTKLKRSALVKSQTASGMSEYSALVPLILAGIKKYQNIGYTEWDNAGLEYVMDKGLYDAIMYTAPDLSNDRLLEIRHMGLMNKSGPNMGELKKAVSTWKLTGIKNTELGEAPPLATTILSQIWVAHPSIRNKYMILDLKDWDNMPPPLIEVGTTKLLKEQPIANDLPW